MEDKGFGKIPTVEQQYILGLKTIGEIKLLNCLIAVTGGAYHPVYYTNEQLSIFTGLGVSSIVRAIASLKYSKIITCQIVKKRTKENIIPLRKIILNKESVYPSQDLQEQAKQQIKEEWKRLRDKNRKYKNDWQEKNQKVKLKDSDSQMESQVEIQELEDFTNFEF